MGIGSFCEKNKNKWWFILIGGIVIFVLYPALVLFIDNKFFSTSILPDIDSNVIYNSGPVTAEYESRLKLTLKDSKIPYLVITIANNGKGAAENFNTELLLLGSNKIVEHKKTYIPSGLKIWVKKSNVENKIFHEELEYLPSEAAIEYEFILKKFIKSNKEFSHSLLSKNKNWTKSAKIIPRHSFAHRPSKGIAYAEDISNEDTKTDIPKSSVLIGGYDPFVMSNGLFHLLQKRNLLSNEDAREIKKIVETHKEGVLLGGINILKFNELIVNKLIDNELITVKQARDIIEKSKESGGVLVGGYNVIILEAEILNALLENGEITYAEGQKVIDRAGKVTISPIGPDAELLK